MKWIIRIGLVLVVAIAGGWIFRAEIALFGINQMMAAQAEIGPTQEINWSTGTDAEGRSPEDRPPNIVLILADDLGWNDLSMNGPNPTTQTPNIDALAAEGLTFSQGYAANGTCAPSRAALMSGRYGTRFGFEFTPTPAGMMPIVGLVSNTMDRPLQPPILSNTEEGSLSFDEMGMPPSEITLAELLADQGYHTVHIGKWHLGQVNGMAAHDQGFAESLLMASGLYGRRDDAEVIQARQDFDPIDRFLWAALNFAASFNGGPLFEPPKYLTDYYTDQAVKVIEANKDRPFFLYLAHWAPHTPLQASKEDYAALSHIELHRERVYAAMIRSLDRGVGRVMQALKANGLDENTLVMFTSDNGGAGYIGLPDVNEPYRGWKITLFEGGIRVPFLARWPARLPAGETFDAPVHHFDMYATAAAAAGADLPTDRVMDGVDLTAYVTGIDTTQAPHEYLFFRSGAAQAVRDERWKLMVSAPEGQPRKEWLFDLTAEGEWRDLLAEQPDVAVRLRQALEGHNAEQQPSRWPWVSTTAYNVDRDLSQEDEPDDEFAYWSN
ncbi:MAG TPA: sulfatase [Gammaproteobacteria bacterium]|nr:sulfatase [Gammaproteobacteria bacterium]HBK11598.1 sulfatase [Gammaproteobacteria bacterium]